MTRRWWRGHTGGGPFPRVAGRPPSANGASSFHLFWPLAAPEPVVAVAATLTVVVPPAVDRLYFWALQASFHDGTRHRGAGHVGLQWHPSHPGSTAANWGGYGEDGVELGGSMSGLPSATGNPNTRDYRWEPGREYRVGIRRSPEGRGWRGEITDRWSGVTTVVRDLYAPGDRLADPVVWSEVFAHCDDPSVVVRWSALEARTVSGDTIAAPSVRVSFQANGEGGCDNTDVEVTPEGVVQVTNAARRVATGTVIATS